MSPTDIIREVKIRPALYLRDHEDRVNIPNFRKVLWRQIAEKLLPQWSTLSKSEQTVTVVELQKKWRNIKDCYRKEMRAMKQPKAGQQKHKRKYIYFNKLSFLRPVVETDIEASIYIASKRYITTKKKGQKRIPNSDDYEVYDPQTALSSPIATENVATNSSIQNVSVPNIAYTNMSEEIDEDKHFLLSLVPTFKRMNQDQKLSAKMEILNILRNIQVAQYYNPDMIVNPLNDTVFPEEDKKKRPNLKIELESSEESS